MDPKIIEIAQRIQGMREILELTPEEMAEATDVSVEEYLQYESGTRDFGFTFLFECAKTFGIDIVELMTGEKPKLSSYTIVRAGKGLPIKRRKGFTYQHLAYRMKNKLAEPFVVTAPYSEAEQDAPILLTHHKGQEMDYVLKGALKMQVKDHVEVLNEGDSIYYDSSNPHGMIATGGADCMFLAMVIREPGEKK